MLRHVSLLAVMLFGIVLSTPIWAASKAVIKAETRVYSEASEASVSLGTYHARTTVSLDEQPVAGWYRVTFPTPVKGHNEGWVRQDAVERMLAAGSQPPPRRAESDHYKEKNKERRKYSNDEPRFRIGLSAGLSQVSPSSFQSKTGDTYASGTALAYGLDLGYRLSENLDGSLGIDLFNFTQKSGTSGVSDGVFADGYSLVAGLDYLMVNGKTFTLGPGIGLGVSAASAGNNNGAVKKTTSGIIAPLYLVRLASGLRFGDSSFAMRFELGYRIQTLTDVPVTTLSTSQAALADLSLSGLFAGIGLNYLF